MAGFGILKRFLYAASALNSISNQQWNFSAGNTNVPNHNRSLEKKRLRNRRRNRISRLARRVNRRK